MCQLAPALAEAGRAIAVARTSNEALHIQLHRHADKQLSHTLAFLQHALEVGQLDEEQEKGSHGATCHQGHNVQVQGLLVHGLRVAVAKQQSG